MSEKAISTERIYDGKIVRLRRDKVVLPNGRETFREVAEHSSAAVIVAENERGELLMIRQFRYPIGREIIEFPAGLVEPGEGPIDAANRELQEETGWKAGRLEHITSVYASPGFTTELFEMFHASQLERSKLEADDDEFITSRFYSREEIEEIVDRGEIIDSKTLLGIYWWLHEHDRAGAR